MTIDRQSQRQIPGGILSIEMEPSNHAIVLNISDGGLGFHALSPLAQSGTIRFSFTDDGQQIEASGELVWIDSMKKNGGLTFASLPPADRERIRNWVDRVGNHRRTQAASEPTTPPPGESPVSNSFPPRASAPPGSHFTPLGMDSPLTAQPGFGLLEDTPRRPAYGWDEEMAFPQSRTKFFGGFLVGIAASAILAAVLFFNNGDTMRALRDRWNELIGASPAQQTAPATAPAIAVPPPLPPSGLNPPSSADLPPASASPSISGDDSGSESAAAKPSAETPPADDHVQRPHGNLSPKIAAPGAEDLASAQRYLNTKQGPGGSAAASRFLWAAVQKGNVEAEITLADLYARGDGVKKSCEQSRVLLRAAARKGNSEASQKLAQIIRGGC
jgi:PilZ domain-containing protein